MKRGLLVLQVYALVIMCIDKNNIEICILFSHIAWPTSACLSLRWLAGWRIADLVDMAYVYYAYVYIHTMVPCDTLTPRALRVTAHAICQWVLVRFELAIFGSQAERSNHYTSVAAYILQCPVCPRGAINNTPRYRSGCY